VDEDDPISLKKLLKREGAWDIIKEILGFVFNGNNKTMWLAEEMGCTYSHHQVMATLLPQDKEVWSPVP
jgi:hypothetical protein